jgi:sentrin-specific protease 2 (axin associating molecule)
VDTLKTKARWKSRIRVRTAPKQYRVVETRGPLGPMRSEKRCFKGEICDIEKNGWNQN